MTYSSQSSPDVNLRLVWPQWQGCRHGERATACVRIPVRRRPSRVRGRLGGPRGGAAAARRPDRDCPVSMTDEGLAERDGVEAKAMVVEQLARALEIIRQHNPRPGSRQSVESAR